VPVTFVKVCGITREADALAAARLGATALGFVFWQQSPRRISPTRAGAIVRQLPPGIEAVGVFVNQGVDEIAEAVAEAHLTTVQLHGDESVAFAETVTQPVLKAASLAGVDAVLDEWPEDVVLLLDAHDPVARGGTGRIIDWLHAADIASRRRVVLAGGLTPGNVREAIEAVRPFGVDVSSGVEAAPGVKDLDKMQMFLEQVKAAADGR
jgi:phosphoribosylanthranilate isomerase